MVYISSKVCLVLLVPRKNRSQHNEGGSYCPNQYTYCEGMEAMSMPFGEFLAKLWLNFS